MTEQIRFNTKKKVRAKVLKAPQIVWNKKFGVFFGLVDQYRACFLNKIEELSSPTDHIFIREKIKINATT
ncbi:MAG: hypothetical protein Alis3KO_41300 [Aliiglaciecola sp.]